MSIERTSKQYGGKNLCLSSAFSASRPYPSMTFFCAKAKSRILRTQSPGSGLSGHLQRTYVILPYATLMVSSFSTYTRSQFRHPLSHLWHRSMALYSRASSGISRHLMMRKTTLQHLKSLKPFGSLPQFHIRCREDQGKRDVLGVLFNHACLRNRLWSGRCDYRIYLVSRWRPLARAG